MATFRYTHEVLMEMDALGEARSCSAHDGTCEGAKQKT